MKNSTLSTIMKRAWAIKKENKLNIFSICLKMAWAESRINTSNFSKETLEKIEVKGLNYFLTASVRELARKDMKAWNEIQESKKVKTVKAANYNNSTVVTIAKFDGRDFETGEEIIAGVSLIQKTDFGWALASNC